MTTTIDKLSHALKNNIYGLSDKKSKPIAEYIVFSSLSILRGRNKNPILQNAGSISTRYFQEEFKVSYKMCADIIDFCFDRLDEYRTGACKPSRPKAWLKEMTLDYVSEMYYDASIKTFSADTYHDDLPVKENFYIEFNLPIDNIQQAIVQAKLLSNEDEYYQYGPNEGEIKNNRDEFKLAQVYLEAGLKRNGYFCERYNYKKCGRLYQSGYGFQNMKKVIRNIVFKGYYNIDINSSFFRMATDLYSDQWGVELNFFVDRLLNNKDAFYSDVQNPHEMKIHILSLLLGCNDPNVIFFCDETIKLNKLLNEWMSPNKRRKQLANDLFHKEQEYVQTLIKELKEIPHVLIHDGFIVKNNYKLDEKIWSIKKL